MGLVVKIAKNFTFATVFVLFLLIQSSFMNCYGFGCVILIGSKRKDLINVGCVSLVKLVIARQC